MYILYDKLVIGYETAIIIYYYIFIRPDQVSKFDMRKGFRAGKDVEQECIYGKIHAGVKEFRQFGTGDPAGSGNMMYLYDLPTCSGRKWGVRLWM